MRPSLILVMATVLLQFTVSLSFPLFHLKAVLFPVEHKRSYYQNVKAAYFNITKMHGDRWLSLLAVVFHQTRILTQVPNPN